LTEDKSIDDYTDIIGQDNTREIKELAGRIEGATITHINSTRSGGGVAEILQNLIPLANSLGLKAKWDVLEGATEFFDVTKSFHNALQGMDIPLTKSMKEIYIKYNREYFEELNLDSDVIFIHDPQPAPLIEMLKRDNRKILWRCHIDLTNANPEYWGYIKQFVEQYDALIFSLKKYVSDDVAHKKIFVVPPSIDPLSQKNRQLSPDEVLDVLSKYELDPDRPLVTQVARFDYWKDPLGVIDCYKLVKKKIPEIQLLLVGSMPVDDPEGKDWLKKTKDKAGDDKDIHLITGARGAEDVEVNAFQRASSVVIQKSRKEGFGLSVTEALWKGTPVVATRAGGIPLQVIDGVTGFLIKDAKEAAHRVIQLLKRKYLAKMFGMEGKEHIKRNFLITRQLRDYIRIHLEIIEPNPK
jgi:trehalose synthase